MNVAIIPARGGSKRIPRKNINLFHGKPMIAWAIETAIHSKLFEQVVVSTDDEEIATVAKSYGATVPFVRPANLSDDYSTTAPVIAHAISVLNEQGLFPELACCIYPCTPFLKTKELIVGLNLLRESKASFVYPVAEFAHPIQRALLRSTNGKMKFLTPENELVRTQDLPKTYHDVGQFYWGRANAWLSQEKMHSEGAGLVIPHWRVVDIDTPDDWKRAELLFKLLDEMREGSL